MWKTELCLTVLAAATMYSAEAQITPPGLGENENANLWVAVGLKVPLGGAGRFTSMSYIGLGRESSRDDFNIFERQGIITLNQEVFYHIFVPTGRCRWR
ncbi:MAG: hypothetical protein EOP56_09010 [Sphingobacteriales bacterium]|nr:MAG: hypothetical protein EOP56_09010 [Sphingobacteriales bacterium]